MRLAIESLSVERGGRLVIAGLTVAAKAGTALVVTGPNGAGKSTLIRTIAGLLPLAAGSIRLEGGDPELTVAEQCHYFGHQDGLKTALTVKENLAFWRDFYGRPALSVIEALEVVGLEHLSELPAAYLSAGQRRRLSFARLLISHRPIWLLDEPTSALDAGSEVRLIDCVNDHLVSGGLVIAATHAPLTFRARESLALGHVVAEASP
ncbi:MAG: heme ABC exporter ATP-binding protein CcmA [Ancalomicrobiaceae bacterium]|nr:heme ABC exporter ATP-binding protein CcmA [Ancalomicrobiaceae bacterium]